MEQEEQEERAALERILRAFRAYEVQAGWEVDRWEHNHQRLQPRHQALVSEQPAKFARARQCIAANQAVIREMLAAFEGPGAPPHPVSLPGPGEQQGGTDYKDVSGVSSADIDKVKYVFKNLVRDWSEEGAWERSASYGHILSELLSHFPRAAAAAAGQPPPDPSIYFAQQPPGPRVLVPGAGLGRLCLDIAAAGFDVEGNEHSWYMLIGSSFVLNAATRRHQFAVHPWATTTSNHRSLLHQFRSVPFPDLPAAEAPMRPGALSMTAGDFLEVYGGPNMVGRFDCVVTCFFLDTAHNVLDYLEVIHRVLVEGGIWINFGPLLWHWSDSHKYLSTDEMSIEVTLEDVLRLSTEAGFREVRRKTVPHVPYTADPHSMMSTCYHCELWTMRKVAPPRPFWTSQPHQPHPQSHPQPSNQQAPFASQSSTHQSTTQQSPLAPRSLPRQQSPPAPWDPSHPDQPHRHEPASHKQHHGEQPPYYDSQQAQQPMYHDHHEAHQNSSHQPQHTNPQTHSQLRQSQHQAPQPDQQNAPPHRSLPRPPQKPSCQAQHGKQQATRQPNRKMPHKLFAACRKAAREDEIPPEQSESDVPGSDEEAPHSPAQSDEQMPPHSDETMPQRPPPPREEVFEDAWEDADEDADEDA